MTKVFKDKYFDHLNGKNLEVFESLKLNGDLIRLGGAGGNPYRFSFDWENLVNIGTCNAEFNFDINEETFKPSLGNIGAFAVNLTQDLAGEDFSLIQDELYNQFYGTYYNILELVNVHNPNVNGKYLIYPQEIESINYDGGNYGFDQGYVDEPIVYRGFKYVYNRISRTNYGNAHSITKMCIIQYNSTYDSYCLDVSSSSNDYFQVEDLENSPTFIYLAFYNRGAKPLTLAEMDGFFKRFVDNVIYGNGEEIVAIENMKANFYEKYDTIRGGLDLYTDFEMVYQDGFSVTINSLPGPGSDLAVGFYWFDNNYSIYIDWGGENYTNDVIGQRFTVSGEDLDGSTPENDAVIEVTAVTNGEITGLKLISGRANCLQYEYIEYGGGEQYNDGNYLSAYVQNTDTWTYSMEYGDGLVVEDNAFGEDSLRCCVYNKSIFGLFVTGNSASDFNTSGDHGYANEGFTNMSNRYNHYAHYVTVPIATNGDFKESDIFSVKLSSYLDYSPSMPYLSEAVKARRKELAEKLATKRPEKREKNDKRKKLENHEKIEKMSPEDAKKYREEKIEAFKKFFAEKMEKSLATRGEKKREPKPENKFVTVAKTQAEIWKKMVAREKAAAEAAKARHRNKAEHKDNQKKRVGPNLAIRTPLRKN